MIVIQVLLLTVLFGSTVVCRQHHQKHRQVKPHFRSVLPSFLQGVEDLDELQGNIEHPLMAEKEEEPEEKYDVPAYHRLEKPTKPTKPIIDIDKPLREDDIEKTFRPDEVIQSLSNTFGHRYLECEAMYHYPLKLRLIFLNFWDGNPITDRMAGCALLCIGQQMRMLDEFGKLKIIEAMELLKANEADEKTTQGVILLMAQCRGIIDDQQLFKDVCAAGLLYCICFRDGIKALGWTPVTSADVSRKYLQDARDWLFAHLGTNNMTETRSNETNSQNSISSYNMTNMNSTNVKYNRIAEQNVNVTNTKSGHENTIVQTLVDYFTKGAIADTASASVYNVTNKNNSVNTVVSSTVDHSNSFNIYDKNISELNAPVAVENTTQKLNLTPQKEKEDNSTKTLL